MMMRATFRIKRRIFPRSYEEFSDYIICSIEVLTCNKNVNNKTDVTLKGYLPSCAPYFIYEAENIWQRDDGTWATERNKTSFKLHEDLRVNGLMHMLMHEFPKANAILQTDAIRRYTAETAIRAIQEMIKCGDLVTDDGDSPKIDVRFIRALPIMTDVVIDCCDLFRVGYMEPIVALYAKQNAKVYKRLCRMSAATLQELHSVMDTDPLSMCYKTVASARFDLPAMTYDALLGYVRKHPDKYKPYELCAARILAFWRKQRAIDSAMTLDDLRSEYVKCHGRDVGHFLQAFWSLVRCKELHYENGCVTEAKQAKRCHIIVDALTQLASNSKGVFRDMYGKGVPCIPKVLTDEQTRAAEHMLAYPLTIVTGPPGRGKTSLIEFSACYFAAPCIVSFVGTNVASHRDRMNGRVEMSNTAHYIYHTARNAKHGETWASRYTSLVWDEFSNVHEALFSNVLQVLPSLGRVVLVLDPWQIHPLKAGCPGMDLMDRFPAHCMTLTENLRVAPRARYMADAIMHVLQGTPERIEWSTALADLECMTVLDMNTPVTDVMNPRLQQHLHQIISHCMRHPDVYNVHNVMDIQFITFKKRVRDALNIAIERIVRDLGLVRPVDAIQLRPGVDLYVGAKICVRGENFGATPEYDAIRNGDVGTITYCRVMPLGTEVTFAGGKRMLLSKRMHVNPSSIHYGHVITCNAAQGAEYNTVVGVMHDGCGGDKWITRGHVHVMGSRARNAFIMAGNTGTRAAYERMCHRLEPRRSTKLQHVLGSLGELNEAAQEACPVIVDPQTLTLSTEPCAPTMDQEHKRRRT